MQNDSELESIVLASSKGKYGIGKTKLTSCAKNFVSREKILLGSNVTTLSVLR